MRTRSYNREIRNYTAQFIDLFNDIVIDRRDKNGVVQKTITVPCNYGGRRRILKSLQNRDGNVELPLITVNMTNIKRDSSRSAGINDNLLLEDGTGTEDISDRTPAPVDISYEVDILTKFQEDLDQIISNFIPFFLPNVYVISPNPYNSASPLKINVIWDGNFNINLDEEVTKDTDERISATTSFTLKGWIFPGMGVASTTKKSIKRINFNQNLGNETVSTYGLNRELAHKYGAGNVVSTKYIGLESSFFAVPSGTPFATYRAALLSGYVASGSYDHIALTAGLDGYWQDISGAISGSYDWDNILSSNWTVIANENGNLILFDGKYLSEDMKSLTFDDWWNFHKETLSGDLSTYYA